MTDGHKKILHSKFFDTISEPCTVNLITGKRKAGKSATFVSLIQPAVEKKIDGFKHEVDVITNIVFVEGGKDERSMPPRVHYADNVENMFRTILKIFEERGLKSRIIIGMDEAHQHMLSDNNHDPVNQAMLSFMGTIRKFNVSMWFISPIRTNLVPKIRYFIDDPNKGGNMDFLWFKDLPKIKRFIKANRLDKKPYQYITWQGGAGYTPHLVFLPATSWITKVDELKDGEFGYDDESSATFRYSDHPDFDHQTLLDMCAGVRKKGLPLMLSRYFEMLDAGEFAKDKGGSNEADDQNARVVRARSMGIKWDTIEALEGVNKSTLRTRIKKQTTPKNDMASINGGGETRDRGTT